MKGEHCLVCVVVVGAIAVVVLAFIAVIGLHIWCQRHRERFARGIERRRLAYAQRRASCRRPQTRATSGFQKRIFHRSKINAGDTA